MRRPENPPRSREVLVLGLVLVAGLAACRSGDPLPADLEALPDPHGFEAIEDAARVQLESAWDTAETAFDRAERDELLRATGDLGELYHAYRMPDAAAVCYRNARRLEPDAFLWPYLLGIVDAAGGRHEEAESAFRDALEISPNHAPTRLRLAEVLLSLGRAEEVEDLVGDLTADLELGPAAHWRLGRAAASLGRTEDAAGHFSEVLVAVPDAAGVHHALGLALRDLGRPDEAEKHVGRRGAREIPFPDAALARLEELPTSAGSFLRRGNRALLAGDFADAERLFHRATEADPGNPEAWRSLGMARSRQGDVEGEIEALRRGLESDPDHVWLHADLGSAYLAARRLNEAEAEFDAALARAPDLARAHQGKGQILASREQWAAARPHLDAAMEGGSPGPRLRRLHAVARARTGDVDGAVEVLRELRAAARDDVGHRDALANVLEEAGRTAEAAAVYSATPDAPPEQRAELARLRGELLWRGGEREAALEAFAAGVAAAPESSPAHLAYGNALQVAGRREQALEQFRRAVELDPSDRRAWLSEGLLLVVEKRWEEARERLDEAVELHPDDPALAHALARLLATAPLARVRDGVRAIELARQALAAEGSLEHSETVAMALAEAGQFEQAIAWQRGLAQQASTLGDRGTLSRLVRTLRLYEARRPVRAD